MTSWPIYAAGCRTSMPPDRDREAMAMGTDRAYMQQLTAY